MLILDIQSREYWDDAQQLFIRRDSARLELEHSLVSLSKWESIWEKPFMGSAEKTNEEILAYIQCMCLTPNVSPEVFQLLDTSHFEQVNTYINAKMSATWFSESSSKAGGGRKVITAEVLYYWMIAQNIPLKCESWHLNRLFTLIKVCNEENAPKKKGRSRDALSERRRLNAARQAQLNSTG